MAIGAFNAHRPMSGHLPPRRQVGQLVCFELFPAVRAVLHCCGQNTS
ncbi:hypothetical protein X975_19187, partial [Stegodyphus mimosarum]